MAYNENTAKRVQDALSGKKGIFEKKMFGGLCFLLDGKMICGVNQDNILFRVNPEEGESLSKKSGVSQMVHNGRAMNGFLYVEKEEYKTDKDLEDWLERSITFVESLPKKK
ncbi:TfoX/Sxy family protein [Candidatus Daviesbacteria bacterium]|nr:TfoX/Sxy family protein [Candidatus Daviesbacteria bacterium]